MGHSDKGSFLCCVRSAGSFISVAHMKEKYIMLSASILFVNNFYNHKSIIFIVLKVLYNSICDT